MAAQTGVTRFTQINKQWTYSKTESLEPEELQEYTHLLIEAKSKYSPSLKSFMRTHNILDSVEMFSHIAMNYKLVPPIRIKTKPALFILERKNFREYPRGIPATEFKTSVENDEEIFETESEQMELNYEEDDIVYNDPVDSTVSEVNLDEEFKEEEIVEEHSAKNEEVLETANENIITTEDKFIESEIEQEKQANKKMNKIKKTIDDLKVYRQERKKKAITKIKSETRKEVVASAKEKLKEIMKRHKHIADELSGNIITETEAEPKKEETDGRGDIPEKEFFGGQEDAAFDEIENEPVDNNAKDDIPVTEKSDNHTKENIESIVEEVIARLIDRKIYDDKTKPEDIKVEDRKMIQKIVEEILSERMNYTKINSK